MHEILRGLAPGSRILDLGCRSGSFPSALCPDARIVRLDMERGIQAEAAAFVQADAARLPFPDDCFDVVIANHSLEHMTELDLALAEVGRVTRSSGSLYVAVPDSTTFSDKLYRWIYRGGGHVNPFRSMTELDAAIRRHVGLELSGHRVLHSSFGFLERRHFPERHPRRLWLIGDGHPAAVGLLSYASRVLDSLLGTRFSVYGWALYYGRTTDAVEVRAWRNVCVRCGSAQPAHELRPRRWMGVLRVYLCPVCGFRNGFTPDRRASPAGP